MAEVTTITSPEVNYKLRLADGDGETILEAEVIYLDHLLAQSQSDVDLTDESSVTVWLPIFASKINDVFDTEISDTDAFFLAKEAVRLMWDLKKKYAIT
tara:strand:+ start:628 stop:924 length:297 start_codon:yes stop_codon:yes gene_type:complete